MKKIQIKLATTCNKHEQQHDIKNNAELWAKWMKKTWKNLEETIRVGRNKSV